MALSDLEVKKCQTREKEYELTDQKGLVVRIYPSGKKTWWYRYQYEGKPRRVNLGDYPGISLSDARERHIAAMLLLQQGKDPGVEAREEKIRTRTAYRFPDLLDEFWKMELSKQKAGKERRRLVEKDVIPLWQKRKVASLTRRDAVLLLDKMRDRAPVGANRLQGVLVRMFNFASERGIIEHSPLTGMKRPKENARSRVLTDEEIKLLWDALSLDRKDIDIFHPTKLALKMILLTGQRPGEVAGMRWSDINGDIWTISEAVSKTGEESCVPLCSMSQEVLNEALAYSDGRACVFPSSHKAGKPLTTRALSNALRRHRSEIGIEQRFTPHDLRRTLRTRLAALGVDDVVAEKVLNHKLQGVLAIYNRYTYENEKRQALLKWENEFRRILGFEPKPAAKVIPFGKVRNA